MAQIIARTEETVVAMTGIRAYPGRVELHPQPASAQHRCPGQAEAVAVPPEPAGTQAGEPPADRFLRLAIQFANGRSVTNFNQPTFRSDDRDFNHAMLSEGPGTGGEADGWIWDRDYRVRPLPPPGPLGLPCAWPGQGSGVAGWVDAGAILDLAARAMAFWPDDQPCSQQC